LLATFVILNVVKDLRVFFLLCGKGWRSQDVHFAGNKPKGKRRSIRRCAPQDDKSMGAL
jgi:hypothetical protein